MSPEDKKYTIEQAQLQFAKSIWNGIWTLLEKADRTPSEDEDLLLSAYASLYHWKQVGTTANLQRGYWMLSRAYLALGMVDQALDWAWQCQRITQEHSAIMEDFDLAYAQEGLARAYACSGDLTQADLHYRAAVSLGQLIADPEDKEIFQGDLSGGNWYRYKPGG